MTYFLLYDLDVISTPTWYKNIHYNGGFKSTYIHQI
jgi:hypothetical protein